MNTEPTAVVFRMWQNEVIALFPYEPGTNDPVTCLSYMHMGQHSSADYTGIIHASRPATPEEYADIQRELTNRGYNLRIIQRASHALDQRRQSLKEMNTKAI